MASGRVNGTVGSKADASMQPILSLALTGGGHPSTAPRSTSTNVELLPALVRKPDNNSTLAGIRGGQERWCQLLRVAPEPRSQLSAYCPSSTAWPPSPS